MLAGLTLAPVDPPVPRPVSPTICGLPLAPSLNVTLALREPATVGLNRIVAEQLAPAARLAPQVLVEIRKSEEFVPPTTMLLMAIEDVPLLVRVMAFAPPVCPTATLAQFRLVGLTDAVPELLLVPVPDTATDCGLLDAVSEKFKAAVRAPDVVGLKTTVTVQLAEAARLPPQVLAEMLKSPAFAPVKPMLLIVIEAVLPFLKVAVCDPLDEPTGTDP